MADPDELLDCVCVWNAHSSGVAVNVAANSELITSQGLGTEHVTVHVV